MGNFKKVHQELIIANNLVQLLMEGPSENWVFLDALENYHKEEEPNGHS